MPDISIVDRYRQGTGALAFEFRACRGAQIGLWSKKPDESRLWPMIGACCASMSDEIGDLDHSTALSGLVGEVAIFS